MSATKASPQPIALAALFGEPETFEQVNTRLPPIRPRSTPVASAANTPDLSKLARVWALIGRGGSGKTTPARLLPCLSRAAARAPRWLVGFRRFYNGSKRIVVAY